MTDLQRVAFIAGASSGIGAATALLLAAHGHPVALGARRIDRCEALVAEIVGSGGTALAVSLDVADDESVSAAIATAEAELGEISILVFNAGGIEPGSLAELPSQSFGDQVNVNLVGAHRCCRAVLQGMQARTEGDIVLVTSLNARLPRPLTGAYNASKAALEAYGRTLQMEQEGTGVRVSMVRPGPTLTELGWDWDPDMINRILQSWAHWGAQRHHSYLPAESIAQAVYAAISQPAGTQLSLVEVEPIAPIREEPS